MLTKSRLIGMVIFLAFALSWNPLFSQDSKTFRPICCIAGEYEGFSKDTPSLTCKDPKSVNSTMIIKQKKGCGSQIWGTVTAEGIVQKFKGTVSPAANGCCKIKVVVWMPGPKKGLEVKKPIKRPEEARVEGIMCKKDGKWILKNGKYKTNRGCTGVFELKQK